VDVVVLRSGVPATIPGRSLDVGEGGLAAVLAGEVRPGEVVGVEFKLPQAIEVVEAKAMVRYQNPMRCGLQFVAMPRDQQESLRSWTSMRRELPDQRQPVAVPLAPGVHAAQPESQYKVETRTEPVSHKRRASHAHRSRAWFAVAAALILLAAALGWWRWRIGWRELERTPTSAPAEQRVKVPESVMVQRIVHQVDPVYPAEAENSKLQGKVVLYAVVGADGSVKDMHPLSGPDPLARAAMDAVRWWRFQPYLVNGQPVAVETSFELEFHVGK